jgi:hypothetical protein
MSSRQRVSRCFLQSQNKYETSSEVKFTATATVCLLHGTVLYCTVLYCTVLYCTVLYCTALYSQCSNR